MFVQAVGIPATYVYVRLSVPELAMLWGRTLTRIVDHPIDVLRNIGIFDNVDLLDTTIRPPCTDMPRSRFRSYPLSSLPSGGIMYRVRLGDEDMSFRGPVVRVEMYSVVADNSRLGMELDLFVREVEVTTD